MEYRQTSQSRQPGRYRRKKSSDWPHILLFYILPFIVFNGIVFFLVVSAPKATLTIAESADYLSTEVTLKVDSWYPTKSVTMSIDGDEVELTKGKGRTYSTTVYKNGSVQATIVNLNGMPLMLTDHINVLDDTPPSFGESHIEDGILTVELSDSQSGINFDSVYAVDSAGETIEATMRNPEINVFSFPMDAAGTRVFAQDKAGNEVQGTFTSHKEGSSEVLDSVDTDSDSAEDGGETV